MSLINLSRVSLAYSGPPLLDEVEFRVLPGERICLLGRNGAGKSCLLRLLAGVIRPDSGEVSRAPNLSLGFLPQDVPLEVEGEVYQVVAQAMGDTGRSLLDLAGSGAMSGSGKGGQQELWRRDSQVRSIVTRLGLAPNQDMAALSGGMKRRALMARALAAEPDLLLLDEPTNHLDIDTIVWLEDFLLKYRGAMVFVSHDRAFARNLATRVVELDRGRIHDWKCSYDLFIQKREEALEAEREQRDKFDKFLAQEEEWLSGGLRARRTRNEGRVRRVMAMRQEQADRRQVLGSATLRTQEVNVSGRIVAKAEGVEFSYNGEPVIRDFTAIVQRGDKVGIIGPNGSGKTTLLKLLLGRLEPRSGELVLGANLEVAYFDQMRLELDPDKTVQDNLADGADTLMVGGRPRHVISYLKEFLFTPDRARSPVRILSGGERNRLLLAKLFAKPANLLVLDEPTNDLDRDTLELLENLLVEFEGTVLLVSHDRQFLNNVVSSTLALKKGAPVREFAGGYDDWLLQNRDNGDAASARAKASKEKKRPAGDQPRKLAFKEKKELEELPGIIEALEKEQEELHQRVSDPELYARGGKEAAAISQRLADLEGELERAFARWEELEAIGG